MVMVPERAGPAFAVTLKPTRPSPLPLDPDLMVIHAASLVLVHAQPAAAVTETSGPAPPTGPTEVLDGSIV